MNHPQQVIEVFHELRRSVDGQISARDILAAAASIVELMSEEIEAPRYDLRYGGLPFEHWAVDVALADGGWRVMWHEMHRGARWTRDDWDGTEFEERDARMRMGVYA